MLVDKFILSKTPEKNSIYSAGKQIIFITKQYDINGELTLYKQWINP